MYGVAASQCEIERAGDAYSVGHWINRSVLIAVSAVLLSTADVSAIAGDNSTADEDLNSAIGQFVSPYVAGGNFSGTILVAQGDRVLVNNGYGMSVYEHAVPNSGRTKYLIGSVSKSFTAAAILLLQERGQLELDDPLAHIIPDYPRGHEITVRHLLDHTSGLPRIVFFQDFSEQSLRNHTAQQLVAWFQDKPLVGVPGQRYSYSNANFVLLAHVIEKVSGSSYADFLRANIIEPLNLEDTGSRDGNSRLIDNLAFGYTPVGLADLQRSRYFDYSIFTGAGSLYSTTADLFRWFRARQHGQLLNGNTREWMREDGRSQMEFGWLPETRLGRDALVMRGWDGVGFSAYFVHYLAEEVTVIVLGNLNMSSIASEIAESVSAIVFGEEYEPFEVLQRPVGDLRVLLDMAGQYRFGQDFYVPNTTMHIAESNGQLIIPANEFAPEGGLLPVSDGVFIHRQQWIAVKFEHSADGSVTGIGYGNFKAVKVPE